jgi:protein SCO1/2
MSVCRLLVALASIGLLTSCERPASTAIQTVPPGTNQRSFQVKGVVLAVKPKEKTIEIKHEAIPDYMPAMTMPFDVKDTNILTGVEVGETVSFRMVVTDTEGWIDQIQKLAGPPAATNATIAVQPRRVTDVQPLAIGDPLPDYQFTNQLGEPIRTAQFKGDALAITFIFTRCPFPNFCPRTSNGFAETQKKLLASATTTNWHLLTITIDPEFDKPAMLKAYAQGYNYDPAHWTFATGDVDQIASLGARFGQYFLKDITGSISHNLRVVVVDASGHLQRVLTGNEWTGDELADEMSKAAQR